MRRSIIFVSMATMLSFAKVVLALDEHSQSLALEAAHAKYERLKSQAANDASSLLSKHLIKSFSREDLPFLLNQSLNDDLIRADDLYFITKIKASNVFFDMAIRAPLESPRQQNKIVPLIMNVGIAKGWSDRHLNLLAACVEDNYVDALTAILDRWPLEAPNPLETLAAKKVVRVVDTEKPGYFFNSYKKEVREYTLLQWVLRDGGSHLWNRPEAVHIIASFALTRPKEEFSKDVSRLADFLVHNRWSGGEIDLFIARANKEEAIDQETKEELVELLEKEAKE